MLEFCKRCNNFLYNIEEKETPEGKKAFFKCRSCPYEQEVTKDKPIVYEHDLQQDTSIQYSINPSVKYDATLPTFKNMVCRNEECPTRGKESNIKGIKLDSVNVVWMYKCVVCDETWKQFARGV
jgi:DNA-directed RNA polymerase subunit M/transcription elongation factor TFIIS